jgi:hypothetical protein
VDAVCLMIVLVLFLFLSNAPYRLAFTAFRPTSQNLIKRSGRHLSIPTNPMNIFSRTFSLPSRIVSGLTSTFPAPSRFSFAFPRRCFLLGSIRSEGDRERVEQRSMCKRSDYQLVALACNYALSLIRRQNVRTRVVSSTHRNGTRITISFPIHPSLNTGPLPFHARLTLRS